MVSEVERVVALGASNLTRGFHALVSTARATWGPQVEVFAALGHGRSYGAHSRFIVRTLPGILGSGLWRELESREAAMTRGLVTDVGNDILYGSSPDQILVWVDEVLRRLERFAGDIVLTDLPLVSIQHLSRARFLLFRSMFFPSCRLSRDQVLERAQRVNAGLRELAGVHDARFLRLKPEWYGLDPIHIRPSLWRPAWQDILGVGVSVENGAQCSAAEALRLYVMRPERQWFFGIERFTPQAGVALPAGGSVWLY